MVVKILLINFLLVTSIGTLVLSLYSFRKLRSSGSTAFTLFMVCVFIYSLGYAYELSQDTIEGIFLALKIEYLGIPFLSVFWFIFALQYNGYKIGNRMLYTSLFIIPVATIFFLYTNNYHHLHYKSLSINHQGAFSLAVTVKGLWYYIDFVYKNILLYGGTVLFSRMIFITSGYRKKQAIIIFLGSLIPAFGNITTLLGISPYGIDMNPFYLAFAAPIFGYTMFRLRMFDIAPIARDKIFENMKDPVLILDTDNRIADYNNCARKLFPELKNDISGIPIIDVLRKHKDFINELIHSNDDNKEIEIYKDDSVLIYIVSVTKLFSSANKHIGSIIMLHDITEHKQLLKKLHDHATIDEMTQIFNRRFFMEQSLSELKRMHRNQKPLSLMLIDIDHFKAVNDTYGHPAGDLVLVNTATSLKKNIRDCDILCRYGGEEFAILLPETEIKGAQNIAERLRENVSFVENQYENVKIKVTISIGISHVPFYNYDGNIDFKNELDVLLSKSDKALYRSKENGRNQVQVHS